MGNVLIDRLPTVVDVDGQQYALDSDFRTCLRIILAFEDAELTDAEKRLVLLENLYPDQPDNIAEAFKQGLWFLDGGETGEKNGGQSSKRVYSFDKDAPYVFSAFRQTHGVDLETIDYLHWWKFLYLFMDLGEDTFFIRLVGLRKRLADGSATKEERKAAREMGDVVKLPQDHNMTVQELQSVDRFMALLNGSEHGQQKDG